MSVSKQTVDPSQLAQVLSLLPGKARSPAGRRILAAVGLAVALQGAVVLLFDGVDTTPQPGDQAAVAANVAPPVPAAAPAPETPATAAAEDGPATGDAPEKAAIAWYAAKLGVDPGKVRSLQQEVESEEVVKVLVMADKDGKLSSELVTVRRGAGDWVVP